MKIAVKSVLAGGAFVVAATLGGPMAHAVADTADKAHTGSHGSQSIQREAKKHDPSNKMSRSWGPSQASSSDWSPSQFGR